MPQPNIQPIRYCWDAEKVKNLIRLRAELSPLFTGKRNASKYAWTVVEQELNVPLPLSKIIKKWNNLLQEYKAIKLSEEPKRREWPFFNLMDLYFSDQVNDPTLRLFSSTKTFGNDTLDDKEDYSLTSAIAAVAAVTGGGMSGGSLMQDLADRKFNHNNDNNQNDKDHDIDHNDDIDSKLSKCNNNSNNLNNNNNNSNNNNNNNNSTNNNNLMNNNNNNSSSSNNNVNSNTNNNNNNNNHISNYNSASKTKYQQHSLPPAQDYNDHLDYGNDRDADQNSTRNDTHSSRASEHHNIDQYLVSWNNFHGHMCKGFHDLQKDGQMVDVTIAAGGKIFKAHKLVLSVCSPYFQRIFLDNPSQHPILFMTDVNSNYMAGLLDFMYSGQVNVKYDDLPSFLKVAEAMQIKGLHTESTTDHNDEKEPLRNHRSTPTTSPTINRNRAHQNSPSTPHSQHHTPPPTRYHQSPTPQPQPTFQHLQHQQQQNLQDAFLSRTLNLSRNQNHNRDIPSPKTNSLLLHEDIQNNNNCTNTNANATPVSLLHPSNNSKFIIQQTNINNKLLDNHKYQKYYSKRKLLAQYEQEMRNQKRCRTNSDLKEDANRNYKLAIDCDDETPTNLVTSIKMEPEVNHDGGDESDLSRHSNMDGAGPKDLTEGTKTLIETKMLASVQSS